MKKINKVISIIQHYKLEQEEFKKIKNIKLKVNKNNYNHINTFLDKVSYKYKDTIIKDADEIISGKIKIYGNEVKYLNKIQYNLDIINNIKFPKIYSKLIRLSTYYNKADIKNVWELSNHRNITTLSQAYMITKDERYYKYYIDYIEHAIKYDKKCKFISSVCSMEVSLRIINIIVSSILFHQISNKELPMFITEYIMVCRKKIKLNIEKNEITNNHYFTNISCLIWIEMFFEGIEESYLKECITSLNEEIEKQVYIDGTSFESSTSYHYYITEHLFYLYLLQKSSNVKLIEDKNIIILKKMIGFLVNISNKGEIPLIGDNDSSRVIIFNGYFDKFYRNIEDIIEFSKKIKLIDTIQFEHRYDKGGYYILKNKQIHSIIKCGNIGSNGKGTHDHNDQLSFILNINEKEFLIDPGTYSYTGNIEKRNEYRQTNNHNGLYINGYEYNEFENNFKIKGNNIGKCIECNTEYFKGKIDGYKSINNTIIYREFKLKENGLEITNEFTSNEIINASMILSPETKIITKNKNSIVLSLDGDIIRLYFDAENYEILSSNISPSYGLEISTNKINLKNIKNKSKIIFTVIDDGEEICI